MPAKIKYNLALSLSICLILLGKFNDSQARDVPKLNIQILNPSTSSTSLLSVETGTVNLHKSFYLGWYVDYTKQPLRVKNTESNLLTIQNSPLSGVSKRLDTGILASFALGNFLELGFNLPLVYQDGYDLKTNKNTFAETTGDLRLNSKLNFWTSNNQKLALAFIDTLVKPLGSSAIYATDGVISLEHTLALSYQFNPEWRVATNLGYRKRQETAIQTMVIGDELLLRLGAAYKFVHNSTVSLEGIVELFGATSSAHPFNLGVKDSELVTAKVRNPLELDGGLRSCFFKESYCLSLVGGSGLSNGYGVPEMRLLALLSYTFKAPPKPVPPPPPPPVCPTCDCLKMDSDKDGIIDVFDKCPYEPETKNGYLDDDGCPDRLDQDNDGIPDDEDKCPLQPETYNGYLDDDGCPDVEPVVVPTPHIVQTLNQIVLTGSINFVPGTAVLLEDSLPALQNLLMLLHNFKYINKILIEGHTDNIGSREANLKLSFERAEAIKDWLLSKGIAGTRLTTIGVGADKPLSRNDTASGRKLNRRVEVWITEQLED